MNALIDSDLHIAWESEKELVGYMPTAWRGRFQVSYGHSESGFPLTQPFYNPLAAAGVEGYCKPADALAFLDANGIGKAILHNWRAPAAGNFADFEYPACLAEAYNRWLTDRWLSQSDRFFGTITVAPRDAEMAVAEIRRAAKSSPQIRQVVLSPGTLEPYGKPRFRPIFRAAVEHGLAVCIHAGAEGVAMANAPSSHGWPRNLLEYRVCPGTNFIAHLTSLMTEGVFAELPDLKLVGLEVGGALPLITYLWRFDKNYKALRSECPWMKDLPSVITLRHVRLGSQSSAIGDEAVYFSLLESARADELLLWTSNQPRWDGVLPKDDPHLTRQGAWRPELVAHDNAAATYSIN